MIELRIPRSLFQEMIDDLERTHPFAMERVGFVYGKMGSIGSDATLALLCRYHHIPDDQYLEDDTVGARIGEAAMSQAMRDLYDGHSHRLCIFHVHIHGNHGEPRMSRTDSRELPPMMPGFQSTSRNGAHGILILSADHAAAWVWLPKEKESRRATRIVVVGAPMEIFEGGKTW